jgi:hypothetical protein
MTYMSSASCKSFKVVYGSFFHGDATDEKDSGKLLTQGQCRSNKNSLDVLSRTYGATRTA